MPGSHLPHDHLSSPDAVPPGHHDVTGLAFCLPVGHLDNDGDPSPPVGRGTSQAPRLHRRAGRPAFAHDRGLLEGANRQRDPLPAGRQRAPDRREVRPGHAARPLGPGAVRPCPARPRTRHSHALPDLGRQLEADGTGGRGRRCHVSGPQLRGQRGRPHLRAPPLRRTGHQQPVVGLADGGRGPAQQSSRRPDFGPALLQSTGDRPRVVARGAGPQAAVVDGPSRRAAAGPCPAPTPAA